MADKPMIPSLLKNQISSLPDDSGVYFFKNNEGRAIYIGKARSIKTRVLSHFQNYGNYYSKAGRMLEETRMIDFIHTPTESEALLLEAALVKEHQPKFNQALKDDKSYPFLKITPETYPRLLVVRGRKPDGADYYGPYIHGKLLREAVRMLRRRFPMRTCRKLPKKACLLYDLKQCLGPCIRIGQESSYKQTVRELKNFLLGKPGALKKELFERMKEYSEKKEYEKAKNIYEQIKALSSVGAGRQRKIDEGQVLASLKALLGLDKLPQRIECFDISNLSGSEAVGSMAVFFNGVPDKSSYRRFKIKTVEGIDDYAMMREVIRRRFQRMLEEDAVCPDLVVIDGGKGHLQSVKDELDAMGLRTLAVISIAKQHEHLFSTQRERPYVLAQNSPVLQLIQRLRDEAHRWAINYHRKLHRKKSLYSVLDSIPGVGPVIKFKLLKKYKTIKALSQVSADRLGSIAPLSKKTALRVLEFLKSQKG